MMRRSGVLFAEGGVSFGGVNRREAQKEWYMREKMPITHCILGTLIEPTKNLKALLTIFMLIR
jgi:hypothetical protein